MAYITMKKLHQTQADILELSKKSDLGKFSLREIGEKIGENHPQAVKYHLNQLAKKGLLTIQNNNKVIRPMGSNRNAVGLIPIPILGSANCGDPKAFAEEKSEGHLMLSSSILGRKPGKNFFALKATGDSMNNAKEVPGGPIEDGDYVIVDGGDRDVRDRDYVLSIVDGCANVKRFKNDSDNDRIILYSESTHDYPPILIHVDDYTDIGSYMLNGKVIRVVKKPNF